MNGLDFKKGDFQIKFYYFNSRYLSNNAQRIYPNSYLILGEFGWNTTQRVAVASQT